MIYNYNDIPRPPTTGMQYSSDISLQTKFAPDAGVDPASGLPLSPYNRRLCFRRAAATGYKPMYVGGTADAEEVRPASLQDMTTL
jgi:hypothetical protein